MLRKMIRYVGVLPGTAVRYVQKRPFSVSFDITNKCNLRCPYCYYYSREPPEELTNEEMISLIRGVARDGGFFHATFIGGEPTLRLEVLGEGVRLFPQSWVNTNGLNGFPPEVKPSAWIASIDGPEEYHDRIKGKGAFKNTVSAIPGSSSTVVANTTLNQKNVKYIEEFTHLMAGTGISGIIYSFYTTLQKGGNVFRLSDDARNNAIQRILAMAKEYPNFVFFTPKMAHFQNPKGGLSDWNSPSHCPVALYGLAYGANGKPKQPCAMGGGTNCDRCGCGMNAIFLSIMKGDIRTLSFLYKML
jgi:MoaA/NifB/PqqE/SkfB family radical SAM enzyme